MEYAKEFERDFMRRTLEVVRSYSGPYEATNLLNCLLGLLIVPKESSLEKIPEDSLSELSHWGISQTSIKSFGRKKNGELLPQTLRQLVWGLRNAVAHFRFTPCHKDGRCTGFEFTDNSGFHAAIDLVEMRTFVEKLAEYLEHH